MKPALRGLFLVRAWWSTFDSADPDVEGGIALRLRLRPVGFEQPTESGNGQRASNGKPWQNGTNESFNGKFRDECLSVAWFRTRREAKVIIEAWRQHYNAVRPHSSLGYLTPHEFKQHHPHIHDHPPRAIPQE